MESKMKRSFSGGRLYGLLRFIVISVSLIAGALAILNYNSISNDVLLHAYERTCNEMSRESFTENITDAPYYSCWLTAFKAIENQTNFMWGMILIAVGLPVVFFGGTWLYNYIFPVKKEGGGY